MSEPIRAPATARPGAPPPDRRCNRLLALTAGAATGLGPVLTAAPAAGDATTCEQAPIANKDQRGDSRNATTRGSCDIGAYDTGGAS